MKFKIYKLIFESPLHIGIEGMGAEKIEDYIPSDTLWGAIINNYLQLFEVKNIDDFCKNSPFKLSSTFPYSEELLFFPVPIGALDFLYNIVPVEKIKKVKKIRFLEKSIFEKIINAETIEYQQLNIASEYFDGSFLYLLNDEEKIKSHFYKVIEIPRVTVDRYNSTATEGEFFYFSQIHFDKKSGLFFMANFNDEQIEKKFDAALRLLSDEGIGADRTVGKGYFNFVKENIEIKVPDDAIHFITLSLYHPKWEEIEKGLIEEAAYSLKNRKGFAHHSGVQGKRRRSLRMFGEGSWFKSVNNKNSYGNNEIVIEKDRDFIPFNVYRYGMAFPISFKGVAYE